MDDPSFTTFAKNILFKDMEMTEPSIVSSRPLSTNIPQRNISQEALRGSDAASGQPILARPSTTMCSTPESVEQVSTRLDHAVRALRKLEDLLQNRKSGAASGNYTAQGILVVGHI